MPRAKGEDRHESKASKVTSIEKDAAILRDGLKILKEKTLEINDDLKNVMNRMLVMNGQKASINTEKLNKIMEEQENWIDNFNQKIDEIIGHGGDEEESGSPLPPTKRPHLEEETKEEKKDGFIRDESSFVQVWVSGYLNPPAPMCRSKRKRYGYNECEKQKEAGFGIFWAKDHPMNKSLPFSSPGAEIDPVWTNEVEVEAVTNTIKLAKKNKIKKLKIHTDSVNMFNVATEKLSRWIRSGWRTSNGEPISNVVALQALDSQIRNSGIEITWKRDHGHEMAEADDLAHQGSEWVRYTNGGGYQGAFDSDEDDDN